MKKKTILSGNRRAAVILFFIMVALPFIWLAGALGVDFARVTMAQNEAQQIANAAANAAAPFMVQNTSALEAPINTQEMINKATRAAQDLVEESCENGSSLRAANCEMVANGIQVQPSGNASVTVIIEYPIDGLIFLGILDEALDLGRGVSSGYTAEVSATSRVCTAVESAENSSVCFRPAR